MSELNKIVTNFPMSLSQEENRNLALTLSAVLEGGGGGVANAIWKPAVDQDGDLTWSWDTYPDSARPPETVNIKGPRGESGAPGRDGTDGINGTNGTDGKDGEDGKTPQIQINSSNAHWEWRYSGASEWTDLGVVASGAVGPQGIPGVSGASGAKGADGEDGYSPSVTTSAIPSSTTHPQGGTSVTITDKTGPHQFDVWNGINGEGATVNLLDGSGIHVEQNGTNYTIGVSADYALRSELPDVTDMATKTWTSAELDKKIDIPTWDSHEDPLKLWNSHTSGWNDFQEVMLNEGVVTYDDFDDPNYPLLNAGHGISGYFDDDNYNFGYHFGLWNDYEQAIQTVSARVMIPDSADVNLQNKYLVLRTKSDGTVDGWTDFQNQSYSKTEADGRYMRRETDATLDGIGTSADKLRISDTVMDEIENKSHVYMTSAGNVSVENTSGTVDANFVQYGQVGNRPIPRMLLCATADTYTEIVENVLPAASGMGAVIFVIETH